MNRSGSLVLASVMGTVLLVISFFQTWKFKIVAAAQNVPLPAVFFFGDSCGDTGNNDHIPTFTKGSFPPYGRDFIDHIPTRCISNGKLMPHYFVEGLGIKDLLPPYLDPKLQDSDFITGVIFSFAGSRLDNLTSEIQVISKEERRIVAYHESGHVVVGWFLEHAEPLLKVTIVLRGNAALGFAQYLPNKDLLLTKEQLFDMTCMTFAGQAAEQVLLGKA